MMEMRHVIRYTLPDLSLITCSEAFFKVAANVEVFLYIEQSILFFRSTNERTDNIPVIYFNAACSNIKEIT